jgi:hypothetical protein
MGFIIARFLESVLLLETGHNYFSDHRDIALGFATDGFAPSKKQKHTAWILLIFNYNLPPEQRFRKDNILCVGIIPGPKKPWDADSFIYPLVCELLELSIGVSAYDALSRGLFALHVYVITGFGDIPAGLAKQDALCAAVPP